MSGCLFYRKFRNLLIKWMTMKNKLSWRNILRLPWNNSYIKSSSKMKNRATNHRIIELKWSNRRRATKNSNGILMKTLSLQHKDSTKENYHHSKVVLQENNHRLNSQKHQLISRSQFISNLDKRNRAKKWNKIRCHFLHWIIARLSTNKRINKKVLWVLMNHLEIWIDLMPLLSSKSQNHKTLTSNQFNQVSASSTPNTRMILNLISKASNPWSILMIFGSRTQSQKSLINCTPNIQ